jgi:hypothetical protein
MTFDLRVRAWLVVALVFGAAAAGRAQPMGGTGVVVTPAPMYLAPDPTRIPLTTLAAGTNVRVVAREGDWLRILYRDRFLGDRTGYVLAATIRIEPPAATPSPVPPPPASPGQVAPTAESSQPPQTSTTIREERRDRGYLWLSGTFQNESTAFTSTSAISQNGGTTSITTNYDGAQSVLADIVLGQRVWSGLSISVGVTWASQITDAAATASVPAPVAGISARTVAGRASGINRQELGIHFDAAWSVPAHSRFQATVFAGPSFFRVKRGLVTGVTVDEAPPFVTATFASATVVESTRQHIGANAGVEASVRLWKALGIGGLVRYSRARVPFTPAAGTDLTIEAGGVQAGAGLHFRFDRRSG